MAAVGNKINCLLRSVRVCFQWRGGPWATVHRLFLHISFLEQNKFSLVPKMNFRSHMSCFTRG